MAKEIAELFAFLKQIIAHVQIPKTLLPSSRKLREVCDESVKLWTQCTKSSAKMK